MPYVHITYYDSADREQDRTSEWYGDSREARAEFEEAVSELRALPTFDSSNVYRDGNAWERFTAYFTDLSATTVEFVQ